MYDLLTRDQDLIMRKLDQNSINDCKSKQFKNEVHLKLFSYEIKRLPQSELYSSRPTIW